MLYIVLFIAGLGVVHAYGAAVAVGCVLRDGTLARVQKVLRIPIVLLIPFIASWFVIRSTAEFSPESLPSRRWLRPLMPLLHVRVAPATESGIDTFRRAEAMQPGQTFGGTNR